MTLGEFLKDKREQEKLTINQLSELTNISTAQISRLENNEHNSKLSTIQELSRILKFSPNELPGSATGFSPPPEVKPSPPEPEINKELERYEKMVNNLLDIFIIYFL